MLIALLIVTAALSLCAFLPLLNHQGWTVRAFDFPRLQIFCLLLILIVSQLIFLDLSRPVSWGILVLALAALSYEAWWIVRYTPLYPVEVRAASRSDENRRIRIMIANVLMANRNAEKLLALVRDSKPDLLITLESNQWWQTQLDTLEDDFPHTVKCPLENRYGMHVYSRLPLSGSCIEYLVEEGKPSIHTQVTLRCGHSLTCHFLHPAPPSPTENTESSQRDAELLVVARSLANSDTPVIVSGDLNDVAWSRTTRVFRKVSGLLDPRIGRGMFNTFHANYWFLRWPLDHLFHSPHFTLLSIRRRGPFGSDHFALVTELMFEGAGGKQQEAPEAEREDHLWAKAKHREEGAAKSDVPRPRQHSDNP